MTPADLITLRHRLGLTQPGLAELLGVHPMTVAKWEQGQRRISERTAKHLRLLAQQVASKT